MEGQTGCVTLSGGWNPPAAGWVCAECSFAYDTIDPTSVGPLLRPWASRFHVPLTRGLPGDNLDEIVRTRPTPGTWSPLEYVCHVRDCLELYHWRIGRALAEPRPIVPAMGRDQIAIDRDYNGQDPGRVLHQLDTAAVALADLLSSIEGAAWDRVAVREGDEMTIAWMARNVLHECTHHLLDIGRGLRHIRGR